MNGTITIAPAVLSGQLSGIQQKIYDGQPGEVNAQHFELIFTDGSHIILQDSDLAFADGIAPIVVGRYAVTLSASASKRCCKIICLKMSIPSKRSLKSLVQELSM